MSFLINRTGFLEWGNLSGAESGFPALGSEEYQGSTTCYIRTGEEWLFGALGQAAPAPKPSAVPARTVWTGGDSSGNLWRDIRDYTTRVFNIPLLESEIPVPILIENGSVLPPEVMRVAGGDAETLLSGFLDRYPRDSQLRLDREKIRKCDLDWMAEKFAERFGHSYDNFDSTRPIEAKRDLAAALIYAEFTILKAIQDRRNYKILDYPGSAVATKTEKKYKKVSSFIHEAWAASQSGNTGAARIALVKALQFLPQNYNYSEFLVRIAKALPIPITSDNWAQQRDAILPIIDTCNEARRLNDMGPHDARVESLSKSLKRLSLSSNIPDMRAIFLNLENVKETELPLVVGPLLAVLKAKHDKKILEALEKVEKLAETLDNDKPKTQNILTAIHKALGEHNTAEAQKQLTLLMKKATKEIAQNLQTAIEALQNLLRDRSRRR